MYSLDSDVLEFRWYQYMSLFQAYAVVFLIFIYLIICQGQCKKIPL